MAAAWGLDVLVLHGRGRGDRLAMRAAAAGARFLGLAIDPYHRLRNRDGDPLDAEIGATGAAARLRSSAAREDLQIAAECAF